jgi:ankyrin repeat protein
MKTFNALVVGLVLVISANAADPLTEKLQRGLFEEEANRNLDAAIKEYQSVVAQSDEQRKLVATALFRLGECYRKLGRTNEAQAQYQRILSDFSEQEQLVKLSRHFLAPGPAIATNDWKTAFATRVETDELARVKTLARNSPDLLQNPSKDGLSELQLAARDGYYSVVEFILSQGISPNGPERGSSPAALAASRGHLRIVELLLDRKADVNRQDGFGNTALILATQQGFKSVVELLLARGANVNHANNEQKTALIYAAQKGFTAVAELLLERGADVNHADNFNSTALHYAAAYGFAPMTKLLLEKGAKPDVLSADYSGRQDVRDTSGHTLWPNRGATALHLAAAGQFVPVVEALLTGGASAKAVNYDKVTPLHLAAVKGNSNVCALLLEKGADPNVEDSNGNTSFSHAIASGRTETVALFVAKGADLNRAIVLQGSANYPKYPVHLAIFKTPDVLQAVLQGKPNLEVVNRHGQTPLRQAVERNNTEMVEQLLGAGANPNQRTSLPEALFAAIYQKDPKPELVAMLLKHGANPNIVSGGQTPLSYAEGRSKSRSDSAAPVCKEIVTLLRQHGANEYLQRLSTISYTRPTWTSGDRTVFYRGTNDYNRYTLFEFLGAVFNSPNAPAFPDLARITIERLEGTNPRPKEISLNVEQLLSANDCAKDMWLEWGDRVSIPELDHGLNEKWTGFSKETQDLLARCVTRRVQIIVKQETNVVKLVQRSEDSAGVPPLAPPPIGQPIALGRYVGPRADLNAVSVPKPEKTLSTFRLKEVVYGANVLRASSDPTAVLVTRLDRAANKTTQWTIDLTKVATAGEWSNQPARGDKLWNLHDLWLRDGDVIEIPEKE